MQAPDKIYVDDNVFPTHIDWDGSPINTKRIESSDIEYIRKDALLEWAREKMNINLTEADNTDDRFTYGIAAGFGSVVDKLKSM